MDEAGDGPALGTAESRKEARIAVYEDRMQVLSTKISELESAMLEGRVLWGDEYETLMKTIRGCRHELHFALTEYFDPYQGGFDARDREDKARIRQAMSEIRGKDDGLTVKIQEGISSIVACVGPKLRT